MLKLTLPADTSLKWAVKQVKIGHLGIPLVGQNLPSYSAV